MWEGYRTSIPLPTDLYESAVVGCTLIWLLARTVITYCWWDVWSSNWMRGVCLPSRCLAKLKGTTQRGRSYKFHFEWKRIQFDPRNIHYTKRNVPPGPYKQCVISQDEDVKYLGLHLDSTLTWHKQIFARRKQLRITITKTYWLLGWKSKLSTINKLLIYKTIFKPIWTYGLELWGTAFTSNTEILERFHSKAFHMIVEAPWYMPNTFIRRDLQIPRVKEEIRRYSSQYNSRLTPHTQMTY
jgi:hypothetical protein